VSVRVQRRRGAERLVGGPTGLRDLLLRLGPTYVKVGQFLALRPDLIPQEYCDELMGLLDRVPPFPWNEAEAILRADLQVHPDEVFAYIDPRPVAAGSLAQTHVARLADGTDVAVKVQRPGVRERVLRDLGRARVMASVLERSRASLVASPSEVVGELREWLLQELDFRHELSNLSRLYDLTLESGTQTVPEPHPELSGPRVITATYLRGIPVSELLAALRSGRPDEIERVQASEIDVDLLAESLVDACLTQIFRYQFFHADLHPGNLVALPDETLGFVDFGLCDELEETVRERQLRYLSAVFSRDVEQMFDALTEILVAGEETDIAAFRRDFSAETRTLLSRISARESTGDRGGRRNGSAPASVGGERERSSLAEWMISTMRIARRHRLQLPPRVLSMYRALLTAETVATQLSRDVDLRSVGREFFARLRLERELRTLHPEELQPVALSMITLLRESPRQLNQVLSGLSDGRFVLNVNASEAPRVARARHARTRLVTTSVLAVSVATLLTAPELPELAGISVAWPLGAGLVGLYLLALIQWRRLR
jgi:ubiquinone biosynthesis protein